MEKNAQQLKEELLQNSQQLKADVANSERLLKKELMKEIKGAMAANKEEMETLKQSQNEISEQVSHLTEECRGPWWKEQEARCDLNN